MESRVVTCRVVSGIDQRVCWMRGGLTYDVARTLDGFRLILLRVRASGTGMLQRSRGRRRRKEIEEEAKERMEYWITLLPH